MAVGGLFKSDKEKAEEEVQELVRDISYHELRLYMKNLFRALAHVHSLHIIHR